MTTKGRIIKALSGFYYIAAAGTVYQTRARGQMRLTGDNPLVGDWVEFDSVNTTEGVVQSIYPRQNEMVRPPVANIDCGIVVMSAVEPDFSLSLLDRFLASLSQQRIRAIIYISKWDLALPETRHTITTALSSYETIGYAIVYGDPDALLAQVRDELLVLVGQSGAGKSSLLNRLLPDLNLETNSISQSLGRGKHTTRHVELHPVGEALIADTPGFSALDFSTVAPEDVTDLFYELADIAQDCRFRSCLHDKEVGCAVKAAVDNGTILPSRYTHYLQLLHDSQQHQLKRYKRK